MIPLGRKKYLSFVFQTTKRLAVQYPVTIHLEAGSQLTRWLYLSATPTVRAQAGKRRQDLFFPLFSAYSYFHG
jgi:hypothetical protein